MDVAAVHRGAGNSGYLGLLVGLGWFCLVRWWAQREGGSDDSSYVVQCSSKVESLHLFHRSIARILGWVSAGGQFGGRRNWAGKCAARRR